MPTNRDIIQGGVWELGARPMGQALSAAEAARGLVVWQSLWREAVDAGQFGRLTEYVAAAAYEAEENQRVYAAGFTITLPTSIEDGCSDTGYRRPRDLAVIQVVDAGQDPEISIYDAHLGAWVRIDNLTLDSACPLGARARHGLECAAAARLAGTFKKPVPDTCRPYLNNLKAALGQRPSAPRSNADVEYM